MLRIRNIFERKIALEKAESTKDLKYRDTKYEYIKFKLPIERITDAYERALYFKNENNIYRPKIIKAEPEDIPRLVALYNRAWLTAGFPFRRMTSEMFEYLFRDEECHILIAQIFGIDAGFIILDYEGLNRRIGCISGLGVLPRFQRKGLATFLAIEAWERYFKGIVKELRCEVFYSNYKSMNFIKSLGFEEFDLRSYIITNMNEIGDII